MMAVFADGWVLRPGFAVLWKHVNSIAGSAEAAGSYRGAGLPGRGGHERRRVPRARTAADPCVGAYRSGSNILLIPTRELVSPESLIARTSINRMAGFTTMPPRDIASFLPQDGFEPPEGPFYLVVEPHTGTCYINREPDVARKLIDSDERTPLTLEEGLAIATQHPDWLEIKNGFNLLGSRSADGRVPSIWMSQNAPRLGAVWPNSRHTWLGNAYCMARRGVSLFH